MKKKFSVMACIMLIAAMFALLTACSSISSIRSAYEDAGYTESESVQEYQNQVVEALGEDYENVCTVHVFTKANGLLDMGVAVVLEFNSTAEMEEAIEGSETLQGLIADIQNSELVNGNCVLLLAIGSDSRSPFLNA